MIQASLHLAEAKTPASLTNKDLGHLRKLVAKGRLAKAYDELAECGYQYATLANGVVKGDSFSGRIALEYLEKVVEEQDRKFSKALLDAIRKDMANAYLDALATQTANAEVLITRDILAEEAWRFHSAVFTSQRLVPDAWTLNLPFTIMDAEARELYWAATLKSSGDFGKEILLGITIDFIMKQAAVNLFEPVKSEEAKAWLHRLHNLDTYAIAAEATATHLDSLAASIPKALLRNLGNGLSSPTVKKILNHLDIIPTGDLLTT